MRKWLALGVQVPFLAMMWVACNGDDTGSPDAGDGGGTQDVKLDKKPVPDVVQQDQVVQGCAPDNTIDTSQLKWVPPAPLDPTACSDAQIAQLFSACFDTSASQTACNNFLQAAANSTCTKCMLTTFGSSTAYGTLIDVVGVDYANTSGCIALEQNDVTATGCGAKEQAILNCEVLACQNNCPQVTDQTSFQQWTSCTGAADNGVCKTFVDAACDLSDAGTVFDVCLNHQSFQDYYNALAPVFCGGYPADAGTTSDAGDAGLPEASVDASGD